MCNVMIVEMLHSKEDLLDEVRRFFLGESFPVCDEVEKFAAS